VWNRFSRHRIRLHKRREFRDQLSDEVSRKKTAQWFVESRNSGIDNANDRRYIQQIAGTILGSSTVRHYTCLTTAVRLFVCLFLARQPPPSGPGSLHPRGLQITHNDASQSVGLLWSARRRDLYLTSNNTHNRQTSMPPIGFEHNLIRRAAADLRLT